MLLLVRLAQEGSVKHWRKPFALVARDLLFLLGCCAVPGYGFCLSKRITRHGTACRTDSMRSIVEANSVHVCVGRDRSGRIAIRCPWQPGTVAAASKTAL